MGGIINGLPSYCLRMNLYIVQGISIIAYRTRKDLIAANNI